MMSAAESAAWFVNTAKVMMLPPNQTDQKPRDLDLKDAQKYIMLKIEKKGAINRRVSLLFG